MQVATRGTLPAVACHYPRIPSDSLPDVLGAASPGATSPESLASLIWSGFHPPVVLSGEGRG